MVSAQPFLERVQPSFHRLAQYLGNIVLVWAAIVGDGAANKTVSASVRLETVASEPTPCKALRISPRLRNADRDFGPLPYETPLLTGLAHCYSPRVPALADQVDR